MFAWADVEGVQLFRSGTMAYAKLRSERPERERSARRGYVHQDRSSARLIYQAILDRKLDWVGLADRQAGVADDLVLGTRDRISAHQFKKSENPQPVGITALLLRRESMIGNAPLASKIEHSKNIIMTDSHVLEALKRHIARIDSSFDGSVPRNFATGHIDLDAALRGGLAEGRLHEVFASSVDDAPSATGFAAMLALRVKAGPLFWLRTEAAERAMGQLYMPGLAELGGDPDGMILALLPDDKMLLQTAADAAACSGLGALVVECWGKAPLLTLTASRRLALATERSGVTLFLLRVDADPVPSAAATRWGITTTPSIAMAPDAPGHTMIEVELLRRRAGPAEMRWQMEWNRDERAFRKPALPGVVAALSGDRSSDPFRESTRQSA